MGKMDAGLLDGKLSTELKKLSFEQLTEVLRVLEGRALSVFAKWNIPEPNDVGSGKVGAKSREDNLTP